MKHLPFLQKAVLGFSYPYPRSSFHQGFSSAHFSQGCPSQGSYCPMTWGQDLCQVLMTWSSLSAGLPLGTVSSPSASLGHRGSNPGEGMKSTQLRQASVCLVAPCDSGACTTSTDTTERSRGESRVNSACSRFAPCWKPHWLHPSACESLLNRLLSYFAPDFPTCISGWGDPPLRHPRLWPRQLCL